MQARQPPSYSLTGHHNADTDRVETAKSVTVTVLCTLVLCDQRLVDSTTNWLARSKLQLPGVRHPVALTQVRYSKQTLTWNFSLVATFNKPSNAVTRFFEGRPQAIRRLQPNEVFAGFALGLEELWRFMGHRNVVSPWPTPKLRLRHL